tara:strand:+ start:1213 stop:2721 length:1509 start_codon:yes stop_codon:yes gene_type:complete
LGLAAFFLSPYVDLFTVISFDGPWHLRCGQLIVESGTVPRVDPICFTTAGTDWINLNWLAQASLYRLYLGFGYAGPLALALLGLSLTAGLTGFQMRARKVLPALGLPLFLLAIFSALTWHSIRPRTFSYALVAGLALVLAWEPQDEDAPRFGWQRGLLIFGMMAFWNQIHGGFVYGYAILGCDALGSLIDSWRRGEPIFGLRVRWLTGVVIASLATFAFHPHGLGALEHVAFYSQAVGAERAFISELVALDISTVAGRCTELTLVLVVVALLVRRGAVKARELLPILLFLHMSFAYTRFVAILTLLAAPWVAVQLSDWIRELGAAEEPSRLLGWLAKVNRWLSLTWRLVIPSVVGVGAIGIVVLLTVLAEPNPPSRFTSMLKPMEGFGPAARFLSERDPNTRIFNSLNSGGILSWVLAPGQTFMDGRGDLHSDEALADYLRILSLRVGWKKTLDERRVEIVFLPATEALPPMLHQVYKWQVLYNDQRYCILRRPPSDPLPPQ